MIVFFALVFLPHVHDLIIPQEAALSVLLRLDRFLQSLFPARFCHRRYDFSVRCRAEFPSQPAGFILLGMGLQSSAVNCPSPLHTPARPNLRARSRAAW
jgi:hypothetical protein